jgi:hypothetical protein
MADYYQPEGTTAMNLTSAIMLVNKEVRPVRVSYDPDVPKHNDPKVRTATRHGFTVCKVTEIDFRVNFDSPQDYDWIVGRVDTAQFDEMVRQEKIVIDRIGDAEENRKRAELSKSLGLDQISLTDLDIVHGARALPAAAPGAAGQTFGDAQRQPPEPPTPADPI